MWNNKPSGPRSVLGPSSWMGSLIEEGKDASGQLYMRNRYYDPQSGRFTQEDPIGIAGGLNLYGFANSDPINFADPYGLCPPTPEDPTPCSPEELSRAVGQHVAPAEPWLERMWDAVTWFLPMGEGAKAVNWLARATEIEKPVATTVRFAQGVRALFSGIEHRPKPVNLPAWRSVVIDMEHVASGHMPEGARLSPNKTVFPSAMSQRQVAGAIRQAYRYGSRVATQGDRVLVRGQASGLTIEMWVNRATNIIETAYPK